MLFSRHGLEDAVRELVESGFGAVELSHAHLERISAEDLGRVVELVREVASVGIPIPVAHLPAQSEVTIVESVDGWRRCFEKQRVFLERLAGAGVGMFVVHTILVKPTTALSAEEVARASFRASREMMKELSRLATELGVGIAVENRVERYAFGNTLRDLLELIDGLEGVRLCVDVGHAHASGLDVVELVEKARSYTAVYHLHDNDGSRDQHLPPYLGSVPWEEVLKRMNGDAYAVLEVNCSGSKEVCRSYAKYLRLFLGEVMSLQRADP